MQVQEFSSNKSATSTSDQANTYSLTAVISCINDWASVPSRHLITQIRGTDFLGISGFSWFLIGVFLEFLNFLDFWIFFK
jgi:hypothetical protein